ncbi:MAG: Enhanced entry protein EnhA [uncultured bacterium]|nr:MAG: Enhanced entry protein EnhA [uncultured bacterium]
MKLSLKEKFMLFSYSLRIILVFIFSQTAFAIYYEISGSPFDTTDAPLPEFIKPPHEKTIIVNPNIHAWGAYNKNGKLIRWGIATAGAISCPDEGNSCYTKPGYYRIYSLGNESCISRKYPSPDGGAPMPYCMYFNGGQALHGSSDVVFNNESHGCVRIHVSDAKWLRYQFAEGPNANNQFRGTRIIIKAYE